MTDQAPKRETAGPLTAAMGRALHNQVIGCRYTEEQEYNACPGPEYHVSQAKNLLADEFLRPVLDAERAARAEPGLREALAYDLEVAMRGGYVPELPLDMVVERLIGMGWRRAALETHGEPPPSRSVMRRTNIQQGRPMNEGIETAHGGPPEVGR